VISWKTGRAEVSASGNLGYAGGSHRLTFQGADGKPVEEKGRGLSIWKKDRDRNWKAIQDIWNADK